MLRAVATFRRLPMPAIDNVAVHVERARFASGEAIFHQGDHGDRFYAIESGQAEVLGDGRLIRTLGAGEGFGEVALLHDTLRTTTIPCEHDAPALHVPPAPLSWCRHVVPVERAREAETLARDRLAVFDPRADSPQIQEEGLR